MSTVKEDEKPSTPDGGGKVKFREEGKTRKAQPWGGGGGREVSSEDFKMS